MTNARAKYTAFLGALAGVGLLAQAEALRADPIAIVTTPSGAGQTTLIGTDTLNQVSDILFAAMIASGDLTQITTYAGLGSSCGERQMAGSPTPSEPACTPTDANGGPEGNPGCQEISPMSRHMNSSICDDDYAAPNTTNVSAEALAICVDSVVVFTDNLTHGQYASSLAECSTGDSNNVPPNTPATFPGGNYDEGTLRHSGDMPLPGGGVYTIGGGLLGTGPWKDVLRLVYTGCLNSETASACAAVPVNTRATRVERQTIVDNWAYLVKSNAGLAGEAASNVGVDCPGANCTQLRQAYRRDDSSGTTGVFLEVLGVAHNLNGRTRLISVTGEVQAASTTHSFVDKGDLEGFWPNQNPGLAGTVYGDPITRPCVATDDLCRSNGTMGIVRAIRSAEADGYPPNQCTRGRFARQPFLATAQAVCPDGLVPSAGRCFAPYFAVDRNGDGDDTDVEDRDFDCLNDVNSRPVQAPGVDGRAYNYAWRDSDGALKFKPGSAGILPEVAQWRQNMMDLDVTLPVPGGPRPSVCQEADSARNIGCIVGNTTCTIGFASREAVATDPYDNLQEPFLLWNRDLDAGELAAVAPSEANLAPDVGSADPSNYPFTREVFVSAIGGFENITADCTARGGSAAYCADQVNIAEEFYNMTTRAQNACTMAGFIPFPNSRCQGAQLTAGCGAPTVQAKTECLPQ